jgi:hypothetical protein
MTDLNIAPARDSLGEEHRRKGRLRSRRQLTAVDASRVNRHTVSITELLIWSGQLFLSRNLRTAIYRVGSCAEAFFTLEGDVLTMTDCDGEPIRTSGGDVMCHTMAPGENPVAIAKRFALQIHRAANGDDMAGFNRPIHYPRWGGV